LKASTLNVTLLFLAQQDMGEGANAYIKWLRKRLDRGLGINRIFSVASVLYQPVDTRVDDLLAPDPMPRLRNCWAKRR